MLVTLIFIAISLWILAIFAGIALYLRLKPAKPAAEQPTKQQQVEQELVEIAKNEEQITQETLYSLSENLQRAWYGLDTKQTENEEPHK